MLSTVSLSFSLWGFLVALFVVTAGHELGHLVVAHLLRIPVKLVAVGVGPALWRRPLSNGVNFELRALPAGAVIGVLGRRDRDGNDRRPLEHDIVMAAGGPLASIVLALLSAALALAAGALPGLQSWLVTTAALSLYLGLLNLLPVPGLDGGHLLVLGAARLGLRLSPVREASLHRIGLRLMALVCAGIFIASLATTMA